MRTKKFSVMMLCMLLVAAFMYGCGSSHKEGSESAVSPETVGTAGADTVCEQCHSASVDPVTGESIVAEYERTSFHKGSTHLGNLNGCEACHGGGAEHFGVGPIPFPNPFDNNGTRCTFCHKGAHPTNAPTKFASSKHAQVVVEEGNSCRRCHTSQGAILGATYGLTGTKDVMDNPAYQGAVPAAKEYTQFTCDTCHEHGGGLRPVKARDAAGNVVNWNPSKSNLADDQFNLCTSCHGLKTFDGSKTMASGTAASGTVPVGHHEDTWYRIIATTHNNNLDNTTNGITGYVLRTVATTSNPTPTPCFDCHGHEARTETSNNPNQSTYDPNVTTIFRDWAMSAHAGELLSAKYDAAGSGSRTVQQVDTVMNAAAGNATPWQADDWSAASQQPCQRCHTATGVSNFLKNPSTYDPANNDYTHLAGWGGRNGTHTSNQREMLYCWGCHNNTSADRNNISALLHDPGALQALYNYKGAKAQFPNVQASDVCIACHEGRESGESLDKVADFTNANFVNSHYLAVAGLMYVKIGFTGFIDPNTSIGSSTYGKSLTSTDDGGALSSTHRKLGTTAINGDSHNPSVFTPGNFDSNGPCVTCHMQATGQPTRATSHTLDIDINAANQVCINCHGTEVDTQEHLDTFIEEQSAVFQDAITLAATVLKNKYNVEYDSAVYPYFFKGGMTHIRANGLKDWTLGTGDQAFGKKLMGACFNINLLTKEPAAFAHARTYSRRLVYDTIDFLDDGAINLSVSATAIATSPSVYGKGASAYTDGTRTQLAPGTTDAMLYLINWSRSTGAWVTPERP